MNSKWPLGWAVTEVVQGLLVGLMALQVVRTTDIAGGNIERICLPGFRVKANSTQKELTSNVVDT